MYATQPTFMVPGLLWPTELAPQPSSAGSNPSAPWLDGGLGSIDDVKAIAESCTSLILALELAGYEVNMIALSIPSAGADKSTAPSKHGVLEHVTMQFTEIDVPLDVATNTTWPAGSDVVIAFSVAPRFRFRPYSAHTQVGESFALPVPNVHAATEVADPTPGGEPGAPAWRVQSSTTFSETTAGWWIMGLLAPPGVGELKPDVVRDGCLAGLRGLGLLVHGELLNRWNSSSPGDPAPGLLQIYDPDTWVFPDGDSAFKTQLVYLAEKVHAALQLGGTLDRSEFLELETWRAAGTMLIALNNADMPANHQLNVQTLLDLVTEAHKAANLGLAPSPSGVSALQSQPYAAMLMAMHMWRIVDVLGPEDIGDAPAPEHMEADGTGFYERRAQDLKSLEAVAPTAPDDSGVATGTLQLKVAGEKLVGFWQEHERWLASSRTTTLFEVSGRLKDGTTNEFECGRAPPGFAIPDDWGDPAPGVEWFTLTFSAKKGAVSSTVVMAGNTLHFLRVTDKAFLDDVELATVDSSARPFIEVLQRAPFHSSELGEVNDLAEKLIDDVEAYRNSAKSAAVIDQEFADAIAPHTEFDAAGNIVSQSDQILMVELILRESLEAGKFADLDFSFRRWFPYTTNTHLQWLEEMCNDEPDTARLASFFAFARDRFRYDWQLWGGRWGGIGVNIGGGGTYYEDATMRITKWGIRPGQPDERIWTADYHAGLAAGGVGLVGELTSGFAASGSSNVVFSDYDETMFEGNFKMFSAQQAATVSLLPGEPEKECALTGHQLFNLYGGVCGLTLAIFYDVDFPQGEGLATLGSGWTDMNGVYVGAEATWLEGGLVLKGAPTAPAPVPVFAVETRLESIEYTGPDNGTRFFDTGISTIDDEMREWIRDFCLEHLHLLRDRQGSLAIVGHADPRGTEDFNLTLSVDRARSFYQALADILGPHLRIPEESTFVGGRGEWEAAGEDHPETFPEERRVDIYLSGVRVITTYPSSLVPVGQ